MCHCSVNSVFVSSSERVIHWKDDLPRSFPVVAAGPGPVGRGVAEYAADGVGVAAFIRPPPSLERGWGTRAPALPEMCAASVPDSGSVLPRQTPITPHAILWNSRNPRAVRSRRAVPTRAPLDMPMSRPLTSRPHARTPRPRSHLLVSSFQFLISSQCHDVAPEEMNFAKRTQLPLSLQKRKSDKLSRERRSCATARRRNPKTHRLYHFRRAGDRLWWCHDRLGA